MTAKKTTLKKAAAPKATRKSVKATSAKKTPATKPADKTKAAKAKKLSAIDAAAQLLSESKQAMSAKEMIDAMATKGLWSSPGGKTPHATLYSAILREINSKGNDARFQKTERGKSAANG